MIYGMLGYTFAMIARHAQETGLQIIVAGRVREKPAAITLKMDVTFRAFSLDGPDTIDTALKNIDVLINCAGPFMYISKLLITAAIRQGHYLDLTAELDS